MLWSFSTEDWAVSDPVLARGVLYFGTGNHLMNREGPRHFYAVDVATGDEKWSFEADSRILSGPAAGDGVLYIVTTGGQIYALG